MMPRDASLSDSYKSDRCSFSRPEVGDVASGEVLVERRKMI